jgi:hypothetical protein
MVGNTILTFDSKRWLAQSAHTSRVSESGVPCMIKMKLIPIIS